jgi:hypothetical protein
MTGMYGQPYGTLLSNVENLTPAAQGGGLSPLQPSRWTGDSRFATLSTLNTPPAVASPTVPYPGQPQYGLQQGPTYAPVTSYGSADYEVGYAGAYGANIYASTAAGWEGSGGWKYSLVFSSGVVEAKAPDGSLLTMRQGTKGYKAVLTEGLKIYRESAQYVRDSQADKQFQNWLNIAGVTPETTKPTVTGGPAAVVSGGGTPAPIPEPPPAQGYSLGTKIAVGVLATSLIAGAAFLVLRQRRRARA